MQVQIQGPGKGLDIAQETCLPWQGPRQPDIKRKTETATCCVEQDGDEPLTSAHQAPQEGPAQDCPHPTGLHGRTLPSDLAQVSL